MSRSNVLVSEPAGSDRFAFLPYMWAVLKTYAESHGVNGEWNWLEPVYRRADAAALLAPYRGQRIDVLGLSCYTWNFELQAEIARLVRAEHPECLIVAGGPDPDLKDESFFARHPELDAVVVKDGEVPFARMLEQIAGGALDLSTIPGMHLPRRVRRGAASAPGSDFTGPAISPTDWDKSPYLEQNATFERLVKRHGPGRLNAVWETNRGCPYGCTFCDWGSSTLSRIRAFDMERARAEADWLGRIGTGFVFLTDANFGILPRDLEIADWINASYERHGFPRSMYYSPAKNNPERTIEIARRFSRSGIAAFHTIAVQHTDPEVLACVDRANIKVEKQKRVVQELLDAKVPLDVHLIVGLPGDTPDRWKKCLATLMEWGAHQEYIAFPFSLLPNAPAAAPEYRAKWALHAIRRDVIQHQGRRPIGSHETLLQSDVVVATSTYTEQDWVEMRTYLAFVQALHNCALTRLPALYLRLTHDVGYETFYRAVIDDFCRSEPRVAAIYEAVRANYQRILDDPAAADDIELREIPGGECHLETSRYVVVRLVQELGAFYAALGAFLAGRFAAPGLSSVLDYQHQLVVTPAYDATRGHRFEIEHDWPGYFERAARMAAPEPLPEPEPRHATVRVSDGAADDPARHDFDWGAGSEGERFLAWLDQVMLFRKAWARANHRRLEVVVPSPA